MTMMKIAMPILFGVSLLASGCTVHHYHHNVPSKNAKHGKSCKAQGQRGHAACSCPHALPEGHPQLDEGRNPHHGMRGKGMHPHRGMRGAGINAGQGPGDSNVVEPNESPGQKADSQAKQKLPEPVQAFYDSFAAVWHLKDPDERKGRVCAEVTNWKKLAAGVKSHRLVGAGTAAYASAAADLVPKINAVGVVCKRKSGDVQAAFSAAHDTLHAILDAVKMSNAKP